MTIRRFVRTNWWRLAACVCVVLVLVAAVRLSTNAMGAVSPRSIDWRYATLGALSGVALVVVYATAWWALVGALDRSRPPLFATLRLFVFSWPGRYAPASLPYYGGRLIGGRSLGLSRSAVAASLVYENILVIAANGSLAIALLLIGFRDRLHGSLWLALACAAIPVALVALHPATMRWAVARGALRISRLDALQRYVLPGRTVLRLMVAYGCGSLFSGLIFYFAIRATDANAHPPLLLALAAYNIAGIAGMLALGVPGGLGVREGVTVAIVGSVVSPPVALSAAVLARAIGLVADFGLPAVVLIVTFAVRRVLSRERSEPVLIAERPAA